MIKPYPTNESSNDRRKRLFNRRLSGLRTVMSENLYGVWKRRFPILKNLRMDLEPSQKIIVATAVLFNAARMWNDIDPDDEGDDDTDEEDLEIDDMVVYDQVPGTARMRGQVERDRLKDSMPDM